MVTALALVTLGSVGDVTLAVLFSTVPFTVEDGTVPLNSNVSTSPGVITPRLVEPVQLPSATPFKVHVTLLKTETISFTITF